MRLKDVIRDPASDLPEVMEKFKNFYSRLTKKERFYIECRAMRGMSNGEIARMCGVKAASIRSALSRIRKRFYEAF